MRALTTLSSQLFWERRLQGLSACDPQGNSVQPFDLPRNIRGVSQDLTQDTLLRSVATYLHITQGPIVGQLNVKGQQDKHPAVYMNPDQPLVQVRLLSIRSQVQVLDAMEKFKLGAGKVESQTFQRFRL